MKILLSILLVFILFCTNNNKDAEKNRTLIGLILASQMNYVSQDCRAYYGEANFLFPNPEYYTNFLAKKSGYTNAVIGDSTMDISTRYSGWLSSNSVSYAVSGNTMCDMLEQFRTLNPTLGNVVIASNGGNDLLRKVNIDRIEATGKELISAISSVKSGKLVVVGVHPTRVDYANQNRADLNSRIQKITESYSGCYVGGLDDLIPLDSENRANQSYMLDSIHYNESVSNGVKNKIQSICGISL